MTIYTAVRMKDGIHYIASNIAQCSKQLRATRRAGVAKPTKLHIDLARLDTHLQFLNLDADMKCAKSDTATDASSTSSSSSSLLARHT